MAHIIVPGNVDRIRFAPPGWRGTCRMCGAVVITEADDCNLGDAIACLIACPTPRCEGRIEVSPNHNGVYASAVK
jgi:hypothetical protein